MLFVSPRRRHYVGLVPFFKPDDEFDFDFDDDFDDETDEEVD